MVGEETTKKGIYTLENRKIILALAVKYNGEWNKVYESLTKKDFLNLDEKFVEETYEQFKGKFITILDKEYPEKLKQTFKPPFVLFYEGNIDVLTDTSTKLAISDNRSIESNDFSIAMDMLSGLPQNTTLILGGEGELSKSLLEKPVIMVLGYSPCAYNETLKNEIVNNGGLVISENPLKEKTTETLSNRYRIISSLCDKVLILTPVKKQSGISILIALALSQRKENRDIPQTPTLKDEFVNNELIYEGAIPIYNQQVLCDNLS